MYRLDEKTDLNTFKISQLRELIEVHGGRCDNCLEKSDYVKMAASIREQLLGSARAGKTEL